MQKITLVRSLLRHQYELLTQCCLKQQALIDQFVRFDNEIWRRQWAELPRTERIERNSQSRLQQILELREPPRYLEEWQLASNCHVVLQDAEVPDSEFHITLDTLPQNSRSEEDESEPFVRPELFREPELLEYTEKPPTHYFSESRDRVAWRMQELLLQRLAKLEELEQAYRVTALRLELYLVELTCHHQQSPFEDQAPTEPTEQPAERDSSARGKGEHSSGEEIAQQRKIIEYRAMRAVIDAELSMGYDPDDVSKQNWGYDILSGTKNSEDSARHIEVKGRAAGKNDIRLSYNELVFAVSNPQTFILAIVIVDGDVTKSPRYLHGYKFRDPDPLAINVAFNLKKLLRLSEDPS